MSDSIWLSDVMPPGMVGEDGSITPPIYEPKIVVRNRHGDVVDISGVKFGDDGITVIDIGGSVGEEEM